jgi:RNA polymerase sigma factor (sigma-70 family)
MADLEGLYRRHVGAAMRAAWLVTGDADLAGELVQEAFVRCAGRIGGIRDLAAFGKYWQQSVLSVAANQSRRAGYDRRLVSRLEVAGPGGKTEGFEAGSVDRLALHDALSTLSERQRAVVVARFYLGLSEGETAEALGLRVGTVKSSTSRGLAALRVVMAGEAE